MLTLFSIPKPFVGETAEIQLNAVRSWVATSSDVQIILVGDEARVAEAAHECDVEHIPTVARNEHGTPLLDDAFAQVDRVARYPLRCFVNTDIILLDDFLPAVARAVNWKNQFLMIGQTVELDRLTSAQRADMGRLRSSALATGVERGAAALDYFVYPAGLFGELPPFLVGRACFDNWLVWRGRQAGAVIDASRAVLAIHQEHGYAHLAGGKDEAYYGEEAAHNLELAGGRSHVYTIYDASHRMRADGTVVRNFGAILRGRETLRRSRAKFHVVAASRIRPAR